MNLLVVILLIIFGYLIGSLSTAIVTSKALNLPDPRTDGSNNPGATNVLRLGGRRAAAITLLGDMLKGTLPVFIASLVSDHNLNIMAMVGLAAFLGHIFPLYYGFSGGKGVATYMGVMLGLSWPLFLVTILCWIGVAIVTRYSSLSALTAAVVSALTCLFWFGFGGYFLCILIMVGLLFIKHQANINRLLTQTEPKIGRKKHD